MGFFRAMASRISNWQKGLSSTPSDRKSRKAAACWIPLRMPSFVRSLARLSYLRMDVWEMMSVGRLKSKEGTTVTIYSNKY
jgi:hypothetical protein